MGAHAKSLETSGINSDRLNTSGQVIVEIRSLTYYTCMSTMLTPLYITHACGLPYTITYCILRVICRLAYTLHAELFIREAARIHM